MIYIYCNLFVFDVWVFMSLWYHSPQFSTRGLKKYTVSYVSGEHHRLLFYACSFVFIIDYTISPFSLIMCLIFLWYVHLGYVHGVLQSSNPIACPMSSTSWVFVSCKIVRFLVFNTYLRKSLFYLLTFFSSLEELVIVYKYMSFFVICYWLLYWFPCGC